MFLAFAVLLAVTQTHASSEGRVVLEIGRRCDLKADGKPIRIGDLRLAAEQWEREATWLELRPSRHARYECLDAVLTQLKAANFSRLGFVGNETAEPRGNR